MRVVRRLMVLVVLLALVGCSARSSPPGEPVLRTAAPPWPAPRDGLAQLQAADLPASRLDDTTNQRRFTLTITINAEPVPVVPFIGMDRPRALQGPAHTHDDSGTVWLEGRGADTVTLGQFFTLWGVRFDDRCLGAVCGVVTVAADGKPVPHALKFRLADVDEALTVRVAGA